jgi:ubiquinone/menaquinone biosynthesis C-methylase UbiE
LDKSAKSILDIGCGKGVPMKFINRARNFYTVGLDIFKPYLIKAKKNNTHDDYVLCDVRYMPVRDKSFDVVLCIEVLEHLNKEEGINLLRAMEKVARRQVILTTPVSRYEQHAYDNNPYQEHRYVWSVDEIERLGYNVRGAGLKGIPGESGLAHKIPSFLKPILHVLWTIAGVFTYNRPE